MANRIPMLPLSLSVVALATLMPTTGVRLLWMVQPGPV
jgi:hypothetical protein